MRVFLYRLIMKIAHRYHWHYAPPIYPDGDTQLWCQWCGFRQTILTKNQKLDLDLEKLINRKNQGVPNDPR